MKAERIIASLEQYIENLPTDDKENMKAIMKFDRFPTWIDDNNKRIIFELLKEAQEEERCTRAKSNGAAGMKKTADKIIKENKTAGRIFTKAYQTENGKYIFMDGYRMIETADSFGYEIQADENNKFKRFFDDCEADSSRNETDELPTVKYLAEYIRAKKQQSDYRKNQRIFWDLGEGKPRFDADFLKDILTAVGDNAVMRYGSEISIAEFIGDNGRAILCPVRKK